MLTDMVFVTAALYNQALAMFTAGKPIPNFKFESNGGKSEVIRECGGGVKIKNYYRGFCEFAKLAKTNSAGNFKVINAAKPNSVAVYVNAGDVSCT